MKKGCIKAKAKIDDKDRGLFDSIYQDLVASGIPETDAYTQAAELAIETLLDERNAVIEEIEPSAVVTIEDALRPESSLRLAAGKRSAPARLFEVIASMPDAFQSRTSDKKDLSGIVDDMLGDYTLPSGKKAYFAMNDGIFIVRNTTGGGVVPSEIVKIHNANTDTPFVRIFTQRGERGSAAYQAAMAWAHNNKKRLVPDPSGISRVNRLRRTEAMISSMLRFGTAMHLEPHRDQFVGALSAEDYAKLALGERTGDGGYSDTTGEIEIGEKLDKLKADLWDSADYHRSLHNLLIASYMLTSKRIKQALESGFYENEIEEHGVFGIGRTTYRRYHAVKSALRGDESAGIHELGWFRDKQPPADVIDAELLEDSVDRSIDAFKKKFGGDRAIDFILYSRKPGRGVGAAKVEGWLRKTIDSLDPEISKNIFIHDKPSDYAPWVASDAGGMYFNGEVHIFASNIETREDAEVVIAHEVVGHLGLEGLLGRKRFMQLIREVNRMKAEGNKAVIDVLKEIRVNYVDENGDYNLDATQEAREVLAHIAQNRASQSLLNKIWEWIKEALLKIGLFKNGDPDTDAIYSLIKEAANHVRGRPARPESPLFDGYADVVAASRASIREDEGAAQMGLFDNIDKLSDEPAARDAAIESARVRYRNLPIGEMKVGIARASTPEEALHIVAGIRKRATEVVLAVVLDENDKVLTVIRHSSGTANSSSLDHVKLAGSIASVDGAKGYWLAHNHPSGESEPSSADIGVTKRVNRLLSAVGIYTKGHIVVGANGRGVAFHAVSGSDPATIGIPYGESGVKIEAFKAARKKSVVVTEVMAAMAPRYETTIGSPADAKKVASKIGKEGIILLSNRSHVAGFWPVSGADVENIRESGALRGILRAIHESNATAAIILTDNQKAANKLAAALNGSVNVLDRIDPNTVRSAAESGAPPDPNLEPSWSISRRSPSPGGGIQALAYRSGVAEKSASALDEAMGAGAREVSRRKNGSVTVAEYAVASLPAVTEDAVIMKSGGAYYYESLDTVDEPAGPFATERDARNHARAMAGYDPIRRGDLMNSDGITIVPIRMREAGASSSVSVGIPPASLGVGERIGVGIAIARLARDAGAGVLRGGILSDPVVSAALEASGYTMTVASGAVSASPPSFSRRAKTSAKAEKIKRASAMPSGKGQKVEYLESKWGSARIMRALESMPGVAEKIKEFDGTAWARTAKRAVVVRDDIFGIAEGRIKPEESPVIPMAFAKALAKKGIDAVFDRLSAVGVIGSASKPGANVNGSFLSCNPSRLCAAGCYSANGRSGIYVAAIVKQEVLQIAAERDPARLAKMIKQEITDTALSDKDALRFFEAGDLSEAFVNVIREVNRLGIRAHVFSKNPELLEKLDEGNVRLLSIDASNHEIADGNNLPLSVMYTGPEDDALLMRYIDRFNGESGKGVILPIETRGGYIPADTIKKIPGDAKRFICPVNAGAWKGGMKVSACIKCNVGIGCYRNHSSIEVDFEPRLIMESLNKIESNIEVMSGEEAAEAEKRLEAILAEIKARRGTEQDGGEGDRPDLRGEGTQGEAGWEDGPVAYSRRKTKKTRLVVGKDSDGNPIEVETTHPSSEEMSAVRRLIQVWITKEGGLGDEAFLRRVEMDGMKNADELNVKFFIADMMKSVRKGYGKPYSKLTDEQREDMNSYLSGDIPGSSIPEPVRASLDVMRTVIDSFSGKLQGTIADNINYRVEELSGEALNNTLAYISAVSNGMADEADMLAASADPYVVAKMRLLSTIGSNLGRYITRSYRAFDDPGWTKKVRADSDLMADAENYFMMELEDSVPPESLNDAVQGAINEILFSAEKKRDMLSFMYSAYLGQKDTSILKRRKDVPEIVRRLLGEYKDPRLNFARSVSKMSYFIANHYFLKKIREDGMGVYLSKEPRGRFSVRLDDFDKESLRPITGLYTSPEIADALREATKDTVREEWLRYALAMNSMVKMGKTVLSPLTAARNFYSASMFSIANGHFNLLRATVAAKHTFADLFTQKKSSREYLERLVRLGVLHDNPYSSELDAAIRDFTNADTYGDEGAATKAIKSLLLVAQRFYQSGDDFWKIIGFENEKKALERVGLHPRRAEIEAAKRVRDTYPTYSMVPKLIRWLRVFPLIGSFTSFPWEIARTSGRIVSIMAQDARDGRVELASRRAVGVMIAAASSWAIAKAMMSALGIDDEDDLNIRKLAPRWQRYADLAYIGYDDDGRLRWIDLSHLDPYTYIKEPVKIILDGNTEGKGIEDSAGKALYSLLEPFISPEIGWDAVNSVWVNRDTGTGRKIVFEGMTPAEAVAAQLSYLRKNLQPGFIDLSEDLYKAITGVVEPNGKVYRVGDAAKAFAGLRLSTLDINAALMYKAYDVRRRVREASIVVARVASRVPDIEDDELYSAVERSMKARRNVYNEMISAVKAARNLGAPDESIYGALVIAGIGKSAAKSIVNGEVPRYELSKQVVKAAERRAFAITRSNDAPRKITERAKRIEQAIREAENGAD